MRIVSPLILVALLAGCADHRPPLRDGPPPGRGHGPRGAALGRLFISPMGEPFRSDRDGDPEAAWFAGADADHDGRVSLAEFQGDSRRWFLALDRGHDGEIDPGDIDRYENDLVPEIRVADAPRGGGARSGFGAGGKGDWPGGRRGGGGPGGSMGGGGMGGGGRRGGGDRQADGQEAERPQVARATRQGAARYSYLDVPEPLTAADTNLNRGIDQAEMAHAAAERFALLDKNGDGYLDRRELPRVDTRSNGPGPRSTAGQRPPRPPRGQEDEEE